MYEPVIEKILSTDPLTKDIFIGAFAYDELPKSFKKLPACFICNTQKRSERGEHWLAFYYDQNGNCDFFDSYGLPPSFFNLETYLENTSVKWTWNRKTIQGSSNFCGFYCILFLLFKIRNKTLNFFDYFTNDLNNNDKKIEKLIKGFK
jgi:hypothetical protein